MLPEDPILRCLIDVKINEVANVLAHVIDRRNQTMVALQFYSYLLVREKRSNPNPVYYNASIIHDLLTNHNGFRVLFSKIRATTVSLNYYMILSINHTENEKCYEDFLWLSIEEVKGTKHYTFITSPTFPSFFTMLICIYKKSDSILKYSMAVDFFIKYEQMFYTQCINDKVVGKILKCGRHYK
jgi:hypothetical protein